MHLIDQQLNLMIRGRFDEGWKLAQQMEENNPNDPRAKFNRGWFLINQGNLQEGFQCLEYGRALIDIDLPTAIYDGVIVKPTLYFDYVDEERNMANIAHIWESIIYHVTQFHPIDGRYGRWIMFTKDCAR